LLKFPESQRKAFTDRAIKKQSYNKRRRELFPSRKQFKMVGADENYGAVPGIDDIIDDVPPDELAQAKEKWLSDLQ